MPRHDIIDNRNEKLVDHINRILGSTESANHLGHEKTIRPNAGARQFAAGCEFY